MSKNVSVGAIEFSGIGIGYQAEDALLKSASTTLLIARTIGSGKYLIVFSGNIADVETSMDVARKIGGSRVVDYLTVANVHQSLFPAMDMTVKIDRSEMRALGIIETTSAVSAMIAADVAAKSGNVTLFRLSFTVAQGGKGLLLMNGSVSDVEASIESARRALASRGTIESAITIPKPEPELFREYI